MPTGARGTVSFAVRWHGARPAVLWEQSGAAVALTLPVLAPEWRTDEVKGETLWPAARLAWPTAVDRHRTPTAIRSADVRRAWSPWRRRRPAVSRCSRRTATGRPPSAQVVEWSPPRRDRRRAAGHPHRCGGARRRHAGCVLSRPAWCWGAEHGVNEAGVAIGNTTVYTTLDPRGAAARADRHGPRAPRARARHRAAVAAVDVITTMLERYGQGGSGHDPALVPGGRPYWNAFLVADPGTAFVVDTSGSEWAVEEVVGCAGHLQSHHHPGVRCGAPSPAPTRRPSGRPAVARVAASARRAPGDGGVAAGTPAIARLVRRRRLERVHACRRASSPRPRR